MVTKIGLYRDPRKEKQWVVRWYGEYDQAIGKQRRYSKSFELKRDAEAFQAKQATEFRQGQRRDKPEEITLKGFCEDWLKIKKTMVRWSTVKIYQDVIRLLIGYFGPTMPVRKITQQMAEKFIAELQRRDSKKGEKLSSWTKKKLLSNCKTIFETAVKWELISKNPFKGIKCPKLAKRNWHYLRVDEYRRLLQGAPTLRWKALYALAYTAGLRLGELLNLTWDCISFEAGEVRIENRPATKTIPPFEIKDCESRRIPLAKDTLRILNDLKMYNEIAGDETPFVLLDEQRYCTVVKKWQGYQHQGRPWENKDMANNTLREFKRHLRWAGIEVKETLSLHTLRKCAGKNWAKVNRDPSITQKLMGHASLSTTLEYYDQVTDDDRAAAAVAIDALLEKTDARLTPDGDFRQNRGLDQF